MRRGTRVGRWRTGRWNATGLSLIAGAVTLLMVGCGGPRQNGGSGPGAGAPPAVGKAKTLVISAAASLTDAFKEIGSAFEQKNPGIRTRFNFASSGSLQQQIEQGAPVDVFASAGTKEMDALEKERKIEPGTREIFATNRLALIAPTGSKLAGWKDLAGPSVRRVAISDPASVPSGRYTRETLEHRGLWSAVQKKVVMGEDVRQTLEYVAQRNVDAGVVFLTDAAIDKGKVQVVAEAIPVKDHKPIVYPVAVIAAAPHPRSARRFVQFLKGSAAQGILKRYGFRP